MTIITEKLDQLAEFHFQKDSIEAQKRALLDEVKVPQEVQAIVADGMQRMDKVEALFHLSHRRGNNEII